MKTSHYFVIAGIFMGLCGWAFTAPGAAPTGKDLPETTKTFLANHCTAAGCHSGKFPPRGLNFEPSKVRLAIDRQSMGMPSLKVIDSDNPEASYLLKKVRGDSDIAGQRMPLRRTPLTEAEIEELKSGFMTLKGTAEFHASAAAPDGDSGSAAAGQAPATASPEEKPAFWGARLIDLPTTTVMDKGRLLLRIAHRFYPKADSGYPTFYGLDGPAAVFISMGYGITDRLGVTVGRSNLFQEWELSVGWLAVEQGKKGAWPFSAAVHTGLDWATREIAGQSVFAGRYFKYNAALSLSRMMTPRWSLLVVPSLSTNTDHFDTNPRTNLAVGLGTRYMFFGDFSVLVEWVPIITGFKILENGWGLGIEKKIGGHVFQVFVVNSIGLTSSQFITGGDLRLRDFDFRFGFNIFRTF
jgi:hypothetical protein